MVYFSSWQDFQKAAENLYTECPNGTRYCIKWNASKGRFVLKVTDNKKCVKFKTGSSIFLNRFEAFNLSMMEKMQNHRPKPLVPKLPSIPAPQTMPAGSMGEGGAQSAPVAAGGVKKKKPKKKK